MNGNNPRQLIPLSEKAKKNFCPLPFLQLMLKPDGNISPCCLLQDYDLGNVTTEAVLSIWNGEKIRKLRQEFLCGEVTTCKNKMDQMSCHLKYERLLKNVEFKTFQAMPPQRLDLRLDHRCNLRCVMCDLHQGPPSPYTESNFWQELKIMIPNLKEISLLGGEPFFQDSTDRLVEEVLERNSACRWIITTNLNFSFSDKIKPLLNKINLLALIVSIDSFNQETYERIRQGGDFHLLMQSLRELLLYKKERAKTALGSFQIFASMCVLHDNWQDIPDFLDRCFEMKILPNFNYVVYPPELSINNLPADKKDEVLSFLLDYCTEEKTPYIRKILWGIQNSVNPFDCID